MKQQSNLRSKGLISSTFLIAALLLTFFTSGVHGYSGKFQPGKQDLIPAITVLAPAADGDLHPESLNFGATRTRVVSLNTAVLDQISSEMDAQPGLSIAARFEVFEELAYQAVFNNRESTLQGGYILSGSLENTSDGTVSVVSTDGVVSVVLVDYTQQYHLIQNKDGRYQFEVIDQNLIPRGAEPVVLDETEAEDAEPLTNAPFDTADQVDVMVVYTALAREQAGSTMAILNQINQAVTLTNLGYERSGVNHRIRLVHTEEVEYNEAALSAGEWSNALNQLRINNDGIMDNVHSLRDEYRADLVSLFVGNYSGTCGIAYLMTSLSFPASQGFSIIALNCAVSIYGFAHELGHNFGAHHDRATAGSGATAIYPYAFGYRFQSSALSFRTIMAYSCTSAPACPVINNWSNPSVFHNGQPTGIEGTGSTSANNTLTLNNTAATIANYRQAINPPPAAPSNLRSLSTSMTTIGIQWTDNSTNENGFRIERAASGGSFQEIAITAANQISFVNSGLTCGSTYSYRVRASGEAGNSGYSNTFTTATSACAAPNPPAGVTAIPSINAITLRWNDVEGETRYIIERSTNGGGSWIFLAEVGQNVTTFTYSRLSPGTTHLLRVSSENALGTGVGNPISVTTYTRAIFLPLIRK